MFGKKTKQMKITPLNHRNQDYEIRSMFDGHTLHVRAFKDNKPANGFTYSVSFEVAFDLKTTQGEDAAEILIEDAKRDIIEGRWERFLEAIQGS